MIRARRTPARWILAILLIALHAAAVTPGAAAGDPDDAEAMEFVDEQFRFKMRKTDSRHWRFTAIKRQSGSLRAQLEHRIGGRKDILRIQVHAWENKKLGATEERHLDRWQNEIDKQFSEIVERKTDTRSRFGRYTCRSYTAYGRLTRDGSQLRKVTAHVFKYKKNMYTVVVTHEPNMDVKYAADLRFIAKNFRVM